MLGKRYGTIINLPDFVRKAQSLRQLRSLPRAMYECRNAKMFHPFTGVITWMSNPSQPSFVWQIYSHDLEANLSLFAVRKSWRAVVHIQMNQDNFHVMVINNTPNNISGLTAHIKLINLNGAAIDLDPVKVTAAPTSATDLGKIEFPATVSKTHFVSLQLRDAKDSLVSENFYWRNGDVPDDLTALKEMPTATLLPMELKLEAANSGKCLIEAK